MRWIASPRRPALTSYGRPSIIPNSNRLKTAGRWSKTIAQHNVTRRWPDAVSILRMGLPKSRPQHAKRQSLLCARKKIGIGGRIWKSQKSKVLESGEFCKKTKLNTRGYPCTLGVPTQSVDQKGYPLAQAHCTPFAQSCSLFVWFAPASE